MDCQLVNQINLYKMKDINDLIKHYSKEGTQISSDELYKKVITNNSSPEKQLLAETYISNFDNCYLDFLNNEFMELVEIEKLMELVEQIKVLLPDFNDYYEFKAKSYDMLSTYSSSKEEQLKYLNLCIDHYRKQINIDKTDNDLLIDLADNLFKLYKLNNQYDSSIFSEIKSAYTQAIQIELGENKLDRLYEFDGSSTQSYLLFIYSILFENFEEKQEVFQDFLSSFKLEIQSYTANNPSILYYWANCLINLVIDFEESEAEHEWNLPKFKENVWNEVKALAKNMEDLNIQNPMLLEAMGQIFEQLGSRFDDYPYHEKASLYYKKAEKIVLD
jgi:tetratricopeptide (TPR) repeat protein